MVILNYQVVCLLFDVVDTPRVLPPSSARRPLSRGDLLRSITPKIQIRSAVPSWEGNALLPVRKLKQGCISPTFKLPTRFV